MSWWGRGTVVVGSGRGICVAWRRGRLPFSESIVVLREVVSPVRVESYFVVIVKGVGATRGWRHVD